MTTEVKTTVPRNIWKVLVSEGDTVKKDDVLFIMEVMKTEVNHNSPVDGKVLKVNIHNHFLDYLGAKNLAPVFTDLDGDMDADLLVGNQQGNIQYYYKKNKVIDCLAFSGNVDISCNVDFSQIYKIFNNLNHNLVSYTTQKDFLIYCDILKQADQICDELKRNSVLKTLLFPTDMGETFKIMLVSNKTFRNSFDINDIRHKL